ncbi:MAG: hypothetical protein R8G33_04980 [Gammaproteobacteria bacterium]|nr:hypothetical protein [Gammaproteobacteria bacterium]
MKNQHIIYFLALAIILLISGCASPAKMENMTIPSEDWGQYKGSDNLKNNLIVDTVSGGKSTNPLWTSEISNEDYKQAMINSLADAQFLNRSSVNSDYSLSAVLIEVKQPILGASMTVTTIISYSLVENETKKEVFYKKITTPFTAKWNAAFLGVERLRLANEGSARNNIKSLIEHLQELNI